MYSKALNNSLLTILAPQTHTHTPKRIGPKAVFIEASSSDGEASCRPEPALDLSTSCGLRADSLRAPARGEPNPDTGEPRSASRAPVDPFALQNTRW